MVSPAWSMAAAVAMMLAGYAWLSGQFPQLQDTPSTESINPMRTGKGNAPHLRPLLREGVLPLPNGGEARFREEQFPTGEVRFHIEESKRPSPMR
jgi:hypothetical protein